LEPSLRGTRFQLCVLGERSEEREREREREREKRKKVQREK
jgi:hypothetical protein